MGKILTMTESKTNKVGRLSQHVANFRLKIHLLKLCPNKMRALTSTERLLSQLNASCADSFMTSPEDENEILESQKLYKIELSDVLVMNEVVNALGYRLVNVFSRYLAGGRDYGLMQEPFPISVSLHPNAVAGSIAVKG